MGEQGEGEKNEEEGLIRKVLLNGREMRLERRVGNERGGMERTVKYWKVGLGRDKRKRRARREGEGRKGNDK